MTVLAALGRRWRRGAGALAGIAIVLALTGCTLGPAPQTTSTPLVQGVPAALRPYYGQRLVWKDCGGGFRCTTATAPLDWSRPGAGRPVRLALTMRPASGTRVGTLFMNPGGPGVAAVAFLKSSAEQLFDRSVLDAYDIVAWDPRGVGQSSAVDCYGTAGLDRFLFDDPDLPAGSAALRREVESSATAFGRACQRRTGALLAHVGTADTVRDLDMLRAATGQRRLDYFGFSYGTTIGAAYADRYPTTVGRMVLDGATDPALSSFDEDLANTRAFGAALKTYLADCVGSSSCPFHGMTVDAAVHRIADLLLALRASPLRTEDGRQVNSAVLRTAITAALYDESAWPTLSTAFQQVLRGDGTTALALSDSYVERTDQGYSGNLFEAIYAVNCLDRPVATDSATLRRQGARLSAADPLRAADDTEDLGDPVCANWPVAPQGTPAPVTAVGSPPILVLATTGDPATPYAWGRALSRQLPKGVLLTLRGQGHTAYRNGVACINDRVDAYLVRGTVPAAVTCS